MEKQLNGDFTNICEWFVDNRSSIQLGEDKTKSILSAKDRLQKYTSKATFKGHILRLHIR